MSKPVPMVVVAGFLAAAGCGSRDTALVQRQAAQLQQALDTMPAAIRTDRARAALWREMRDLYASRTHEPIWIEGTTPAPQLDALVTALERVRRHGIDPERYELRELTAARAEVRRKGWFGRQQLAEAAVVPLDLKATWAWIRCAADLTAGATDVAESEDKLWRLRRRKVDFKKALADALDAGTIEKRFDDFAPESTDYARLTDAYVRYLEIAKRGGWKMLPATVKLTKGDRSEHVPALVERLAATGDLDGRIGGGPLFDERLSAAVARFQKRHGLEPDGVVGRQVVAEMNVPVGVRLRQLELNLERWRWLPHDLGDRYIFINVPEYRLELHEGDRVALEMKVVVGARGTPTPIFSDTITDVVFSPYWNVPDGIAAGETLPAVQSDPSFLARNRIEVVGTSGQVVDPATIDWSSLTDEEGALPYRFRQRPGSSNSLGLVKFVFPNQYDVYLHDTPADALFARAYRALSHGCVRLEKPQALAEYLLKDQPEWTAERIAGAMQAGEERRVRIARPIAVHLMYWTARAGADGTVSFRQDVYGRDSRYTTAPWRKRADPLVVVSRSPSRF